jgi:hypothetical protein
MKPTVNLTFFFSVNQIIRSGNTKYIYGVRFKGHNHFIMKSLGQNDCRQLDNESLEAEAIKKICDVITRIECDYKASPPLDLINFDIYSILTGTESSPGRRLQG